MVWSKLELNLFDLDSVWLETSLIGSKKLGHLYIFNDREWERERDNTIYTENSKTVLTRE